LSTVRNWYPLELKVLAPAGPAQARAAVRASAPDAAAVAPARRSEVFRSTRLAVFNIVGIPFLAGR
jgi:hypothetical protein